MSPIRVEAAGESTSLPTPVPKSMALDQALKRRRSTREFLPDTFSLEGLSALLWAAFGVNREQHRLATLLRPSGRRRPVK